MVVGGGNAALCAGTVGLLWLKPKADRTLGVAEAWGGEVAFTALLFAIGFSGLVLWAASETSAVPTLLALHLGAVLAFFLLTPYSKMAHGFYRFAALCADEAEIDAIRVKGRGAVGGNVP